MSRRSPNNARYQKFTEPKGQTRKSAAAAKPSRKGGETSSASKGTSSSAGKGKDYQPGGRYYEPDTPEYKFWRRMWWLAIGGGLVLIAVSFYLQLVLKWTAGVPRTVSTLAIALSYACIIAAFVVDWRVLRRMRTGTYVSSKAPKQVASKTAQTPEAPSAGDDNDDDADDTTE